MSQRSPYSADKMPWWMVREGFPPKAPKQVQLILSDLCNQDCSFCAYRMTGYTSNELFAVGDMAAYGHNNPKRFMPTERAMGLLEEMKSAGVLGIQFTGGGSPTVHPDHLEIFRRAIELGFRCSLVSNGIKWSHDLKVLLAAFSWVRVSIDAGKAETYAMIRNTKPESYNKALHNVADLAAIISEKKSDCTLGIGFVVTPQNWQEIELGVLAARAAGASNIRLSAVFSNEDEKPYIEIYHGIKAIIARALAHETDSFKVYDLFGDRIEDLRQGSPTHKRCPYMYYTSYIGADMNPFVCCVYSYSTRGKIAGVSLKDRRFDEFWDSDERKEFMEKWDSRECVRCQFITKNQIAVDLIDGEPRHKEFP